MIYIWEVAIVKYVGGEHRIRWLVVSFDDPAGEKALSIVQTSKKPELEFGEKLIVFGRIELDKYGVAEL